MIPSPEQIVAVLAVVNGAEVKVPDGTGFTVIDNGADVAIHPLELVTSTVTGLLAAVKVVVL